jgi:large subunit ribosomal protein L13|uniref:Large ribosomal subunit protein uL13c n=1 Tax=Pseudopedinella elastica TaxID=35684 RepID=A0A516ZAH7_9STRA|nr:ribosomal protein L13 [Pseudopedinella elastica]QDR24711.1 ribosomal protein L13 [Pseudopedinella elastica]|tara:strand:+ start:3957 stop:4388 length:432 start_codon:yes stop_codon:yes gene_type:complete
MKDTFIPSKNFINKKWYLIDAENQTLGRLATKISRVLIGKEKAMYTPFLDTGDYIIVINAEKISLSGKKEKQKIYRNHSGRPGGMRTETLEKLRERRPEKIIEHAVKGMLPKGPLGRKLYTNLKVYKGEQHPHDAQTPELLKL